MTASKTLSLNIDEKTYGYAKIYSSLLKEEFQRKRSYACLVALYALIGALEKTDNDIQKSMTLFRNAALNEQYEISDLYVNNWHIDVRVITNSNIVLLPRTHFENDIVPDFYAVVKVDAKLEKAELIGFADTALLEKQPFDYHYYSVALESLISYDEFLAKIVKPKLTNFAPAEHELFRESYLSLLDEEMDVQTKNRILKHLFECSECRTEFCCFTGFEMVSCNIGNYPEILEDQTLNIIGAQAVDDKKYEGKEETIYIGDDDLKNDAPEIIQDVVENTAEDTAETLGPVQNNNISPIIEPTYHDMEGIDEEPAGETVSDILDELFNVDNTEVSQIEDKNVETVLPDNTGSELEIIEDTPEKDDSLIIETNTEDDVNLIQEDELDLLKEDNANMQVLENSDNKYNQDIEVINENSVDILEDNADDVMVLGDETAENDIEIQNQDTNDIEIIDSENKETEIQNISDGSSNDNVQKVIVDYDEFGEPVYSYITSVPPEDEKHENYEAELSDDDILNEQFETYPQSTEDDIDLSTIKNAGARTIEYVQVDDSINDSKPGSDENLAALENDESAKNSNDIHFEEYENQQYETKGDNDFIEYPVGADDEFIEPEEYKDDKTDFLEFDAQDTNENENSVVENKKSENVQQVQTEEFDEFGGNSADNSNENSEFEVYDSTVDNNEENTKEDNQFEEYDDSQDDSDENSEFKEYGDDDEENEESDFEDFDENSNQDSSSTSKKPVALIAAILLLVLIGCGAGIFLLTNKGSKTTTANNPPAHQAVETPAVTNNDMFSPDINNQPENPPVPNEGANNTIPQGNEPMPAQGTIELPPLNENNLLNNTSNSTTDANQAMTSAFSNNAGVSLRSVNWLCSPQLFTDPTFKSYLQKLDDVLKLNLRKNIINATEHPSNLNITVKMAIENNGNLNKVVIADSSGSTQIDDIVLQSINETFEGEKSEILSNGALKADMYYLKVIIKL